MNHECLGRRIDLVTTIADTVLSYPKDVCHGCIDTILDIARSRMKDNKTTIVLSGEKP